MLHTYGCLASMNIPEQLLFFLTFYNKYEDVCAPFIEFPSGVSCTKRPYKSQPRSDADTCPDIILISPALNVFNVCVCSFITCVRVYNNHRENPGLLHPHRLPVLSHLSQCSHLAIPPLFPISVILSLKMSCVYKQSPATWILFENWNLPLNVSCPGVITLLGLLMMLPFLVRSILRHRCTSVC